MSFEVGYFIALSIIYGLPIDLVLIRAYYSFYRYYYQNLCISHLRWFSITDRGVTAGIGFGLAIAPRSDLYNGLRMQVTIFRKLDDKLFSEL
ncbi:hypothetical protein N0Y54_06430 [Nostoc punctiforme UO1]|uniref:hypothetical protein n=1 Tax=Nostoc punctiforme TaxID=272131 RepID=UPI0030B17127